MEYVTAIECFSKLSMGLEDTLAEWPHTRITPFSNVTREHSQPVKVNFFQEVIEILD